MSFFPSDIGDYSCAVDGPDIYEDFGDIVLHATDEGMLSCDNPDVIGPRAGEMWTTKTFDVLEEMSVFVVPSFSDDPPLDGEDGEDGEDDDATIHIMRCNTGCGLEYLIPEGTDGFYQVPFSPGRYVVRFGRPVDDPGVGTLDLSSDMSFPFEE